VITGWLSGEDCPDCGGPLLDASQDDRLLVLACPGCGHTATWHTTDPDTPAPGELTDSDDLEAV
jgi:uncharacterized Zn finger protein (UPF0148 family)